MEKVKYTEKITLRLSESDKEKFQLDADKKGLTLTTYLRSLIKGVEYEDDEEKEFEPQLIYTDNSEYNQYKHLANLTLGLINNVLTEVNKIVPSPSNDEDLKQFIINPTIHLYNEIEKKYRSGINIPISTEKLIELLEIDTNGFKLALDKYNKFPNKKPLIVEDGKISYKCDIQMFEHWTTNQIQNERLEAVKGMIDNFYKVFTLPQGQGNGLVANSQPQFLQLMGSKVTTGYGGIQPTHHWVKNNQF